MASSPGHSTPPRAPVDGRTHGAESVAFASLLGVPPSPAEPTSVKPVGDVDKYCRVLHGVLTAAEAASVIEGTEQRGYGQALVNVGGGREILATDYRDSSRCIIDSPEFADALFERVRHALPATWGDGWRLVGLNERLRFLRYDEDQKFDKHFDGSYVRGREAGDRCGERTFVTLLLYLNADYEGCSTTFFDPAERWSSYAAKDVIGMPILPATGMVLLHDHMILHAATPMKRGRKYVLRTDVLYSKSSKAL